MGTLHLMMVLKKIVIEEIVLKIEMSRNNNDI